MSNYRITAVFAILAVLGLLALTFCARAHADENRRAWFKSLTIPSNGGSCCDLSDCHRADAKWKDGGWIATLPNGNWTPVPNDRVLNKRSIDGEAYLCSSPSGAVYCFVKPDNIF